VERLRAKQYSSQKPALILMARWPAAGRCKKRLAKNIGSENAALVQSSFIKHTISVAKTIENKGLAEIHLAVSGISSKAANRWGQKQGLTKIFNQGEGGLGLRMRRQVLRAQKTQPNNRYGRTTILIGTDLPSLCVLDLTKAIKSLEKNEIVLGPSLDGGYWLIGLTGKLVAPVVSWPFYGIPWGTNQVFMQTIQRAKSEGVNYDFLREQNDIDNIKDLSPWQG